MAVIGGTIGAVAAFFFIFLIRGNAVWYKKRHRRQRDDEGTANQSQNHMMCFDQSGCRILSHTQTWNFLHDTRWTRCHTRGQNFGGGEWEGDVCAFVIKIMENTIK